MNDTVYTVFLIWGFLTFSLGVAAGYFHREVSETLNRIEHSLLERKKTMPSVTFSDPRLIQPASSNSAVIEPKTPQRVAFEEEEELRRMNFR